MSVVKSFNQIQKNLNTVRKAQEGDKKNIFGRPSTFSGGRWVEDDPVKLEPETEEQGFGPMPTADPDGELSTKLSDEQLDAYIESGELPAGFEDNAIYDETDEAQGMADAKARNTNMYDDYDYESDPNYAPDDYSDLTGKPSYEHGSGDEEAKSRLIDEHGFTEQDIEDSGMSPAEMLDEFYKDTGIYDEMDAGNEEDAMLELKNAGFSPKDIKDSGMSAVEMLAEYNKDMNASADNNPVQKSYKQVRKNLAGVYDSLAKTSSTKVTDEHSHACTIDVDGNGETTAMIGSHGVPHDHQIKNWEVKSAQGHTHGL